MKPIKNTIWTVLTLLLIPLMGSAQSTQYILDESSTMVITGTSTIHDWEADVEEFNLSVSLNPGLPDQQNPKASVSSLALTVPVQSIESGKGSMNRKIYGALQEEEHPEIMFNLTSAERADTVQSAESFSLGLKGNLNVAGTVKEISFPVKGTRVGENGYRFEGSYGLNMKDYDIDPPSAIFGTIKSGEEVEIKFNVLLKANSN